VKASTRSFADLPLAAVAVALVSGGLALVLAFQALRGSPLGLVLLALVLVGAAAFEAPVVAVVPLVLTMASVRLGALSTNFAGVPLTAGKIAMGALLAVVLARALMGRGPWPRATPLTRPLLAVLASMTFAYFVRVEPDLEGAGQRMLLTVAMLATMVHVVPHAIEPHQIRRVVEFYAAVTWLAVVAAPFVLLENVDVRRAEGWFGDPNQLCSMVFLSTLVALGVASSIERVWLRRAASILVAASAPSVVFQTGSRGGLLILLATIPLYLRLVRRDVAALAMLAPIAVAATLWTTTDIEYLMARYGALTSDQVWGPEHGEGFDSIEGRLLFQKLALENFLAHPLTGIGLGGFHGVSIDYFPGMSSRDTHNSVAKFMVEQGLMGIAAHTWLFVSIVGVIRETLARASSAWQEPHVRGLAYGLAGWALMNLSIGDLMQNAIAWFAFALLLVLHRLAVREA
jgi:O-antigen ligase